MRTSNNVYICLITLELGSAAIKYQGLTVNPFQERSASMLIFLIATCCHAIALEAKDSSPTIILFHVSGVTAWETLLWILVAQLLWYIIVNVFLLLAVISFYHKDICELLSNVLCTCFRWILMVETCCTVQQDGNDRQVLDLEAQENAEVEAQMTYLEPANTM